jgi:NADPH-dependent 2,4-dienoyl-CoA reductase/sulfur reductase-like enzyme/nitrite reductase/ring-hydroxylating ferredoxin subunit
MAGDQPAPSGPDLAQGIALADLPDGGKLVGHLGEDQILLLRRGGEVFAISASCTHYSGPLAEGLLVGDMIRCPWHHAGFDIRSGEALRAPALSPLGCWAVEQRSGKIFVRGKRASTPAAIQAVGKAPDRIVIIGGGAAGFAAAERLRRAQFQGSVVMLSDDSTAPVDRPNLSKDYLAGNAPEEWVPLCPDDWYKENGIELRLGAKATGIDKRGRAVELGDGTKLAYDRLLLATGAEPVRVSFPGAERALLLRSLADSRAIIAAAANARRAAVLGASFIGLEVAASLRNRKIEVHVIAPESRPMERVLGPAMGDFIRALHEEKGVVFHLEDKTAAIEGGKLRLESGGTLDVDLVVMGVGVRPRTQLAEQAGLKLDKGVSVDAYLETSEPGIFAAGDIARWPDPLSGAAIRVEHWVVAERQGQTAALNMLGHREKFTSVPFFWSQHYDVQINYVGHAESWDKIAVEGDIAGKDCLLRYEQKGRMLAGASIYRDLASLKAEAELERASA